MKQRCPRRGENPASDSIFPGDDTWRTRDGYQSCSYCGSMHQDDMMEMALAGAEIGPTDKNYKMYIKVPDPKAGQRVKIGRTSGPVRRNSNGEWSIEKPTIIERIRGRYSRPVYGVAGEQKTAKFYFQHLTEEQKEIFVGLINDKKLNLGYPGRFYRLPFFVKIVDTHGKTANKT